MEMKSRELSRRGTLMEVHQFLSEKLQQAISVSEESSYLLNKLTRTDDPIQVSYVRKGEDDGKPQNIVELFENIGVEMEQVLEQIRKNIENAKAMIE